MSDNQDKPVKKYVDYYTRIPATIDGMLGGLGHISSEDIEFSKNCLHYLINNGLITQPITCALGKALKSRDFEIADVE